MTTSADVRQNLLDALRLDLIGPVPGDPNYHLYEKEVIPQTPSKWYLTGFLAPFGAPIDLKSDNTADEDLDLYDGSVASEDAAAPEKTAARKVPFPSSMGLSFLISEKVSELQATVSWGDYAPIPGQQEELTPSDEEEATNQTFWERTPQIIALKIPLSSTKQLKQIDIPDSGLALVINNRPVRWLGLDPERSALIPPGTRSVSVFLVNHRKSDAQRDKTFVFQTKLSLHCEEGFIPRSDPRDGGNDDWDEAVASVQYRNDYEFAVGHNVSVVAQPKNDICQHISTTWIPTAEVPRVAPADIPDVELGMEALAAAPDAATIQKMINPLVTAYQTWIIQQRETPLEKKAAPVAGKLLDNAERARKRIAAGLAALDDPKVFEAFRIANRAIAIARRQQLSQEQQKPAADFDPPSWRPFQLAFMLLNLASIADPENPDRETVDLLFFPTGGGKTEAYLGLAAFALVLRRLKNPGIQSAGVSVLMRYTLRLLTLDQLERASRLICALELERQQNQTLLGDWPFEIGLWVGQAATPNRMGKKSDKNDDYSARAKTLAYKNDKQPSPIPLEKCPWCGEKLNKNSLQLFPNEDNPKDLRIICMNRRCKFTGDNLLPIIAVDEPLYRRLPCFIIATVDKFASLPWVGQTGGLFGKVTHSDKDGFYGPAEGTKKGKPLPEPLPPPDLVIQDELHLISGPLGTMVGLYETAIDTLCTIEKDGKKIRPKVIASTATVRRAQRQIQALFGRNEVEIFPPPGPDRHDSFFAKTIPTEDSPGRLYVGVAAQGRSLKVVLLKAYLALLSAAQREWKQAGGAKNTSNPADPYMTLLGYFNSLRELGGSRRIVEDEVSSRLRNYGQRRVRDGEDLSPLLADRKIDDEPQELTSRIHTNKVADTKRRLALPFTDKERVDVALATNMISVGLDIVRLGLMVVLGQPKTAAEYIQSTSRVGRDKDKPGLVVTLLNVHRPRDRSHYERFPTWHASFYRAVEATSVTPFSPRALDRGLAAVTVALARLGLQEMTPSLGASDIGQYRSQLDAIVETISRRAEAHNPDLHSAASETLRQEIRNQVIDLLDTWQKMANQEKRIQYNKQEADAVPSLLLDVFDPKADKASEEEQKFKAQRSLRDVEPTVNLWVRDPE
ncbi:MAG TPA: helicase [Oscillatoriaceae cyanobacterium M33_DOE_052]|uniref:Helicase n=1 Tax=Planktothricoides sp. SpSt-374 TaxID=2282167 RepID=A0A7C3ZLQ5_9CYAN|nr:helicase [Oscillatoriaceae cyanobacterium M33_DOE_052]